MRRRIGLLLAIVAGLTFLAAGQLILFGQLGPARAVFLQVAGLGLLAAIGTVTAKNLVHAALMLVAYFFLVACVFILLEAEFLAAMQVLVYIGAVAILILFGIMLTRNIQGEEGVRTRPVSAVLSAFLAIILLTVLLVAIRWQGAGRSGADPMSRACWNSIVAPPEADPASVDDMARTLGRELMTRWVIPFEVAGLMLTLALVGAVAVAMAESESPPNLVNDDRMVDSRRRSSGPTAPPPEPVGGART